MKKLGTNYKLSGSMKIMLSLTLLLMTTTSLAEMQYRTNLHVNTVSIAPMQGGRFEVTFTTEPTITLSCASTFFSSSADMPAFEETYATLLSAKLMNNPVGIYFDDTNFIGFGGRCSVVAVILE